MNDMHLVSFKAISSFTTELGNLYSKQQRSLKLYCRLINKTTIVHDISIKNTSTRLNYFVLQIEKLLLQNQQIKL